MTGPGPNPERFVHIGWKVVENNLIGGWCVVAKDATALTPADGVPILLDGPKELLDYVVSLHNYRLKPVV